MSMKILVAIFVATAAACSQPTAGDGGVPTTDVSDASTASREDVLADASEVALGDTGVADGAVQIRDSGVCSGGQIACEMLGCIDSQTDPTHCGDCATVCPVQANATPTCTRGLCQVVCVAGYRLMNAVCVLDSTVPRQIAPLSLGDVTLRRPTLRWESPAPFDGAAVDLCRDRACTMVIETLRVMGTSARPTLALPPNSVVFWRVRGRTGMVENLVNSPTWLFHVPATDSLMVVDTSTHPHNDLNGDGYDDVVVGAPNAAAEGRMRAGVVRVFHGSALGISALPARSLFGTMASDTLGGAVAAAGDVNGDGFGDLVVGASTGFIAGRGPVGTASIFHGSPAGIAAVATTVLEGGASMDGFGTSVASAGDVNADGYADLIIGSPAADPAGRFNAGAAAIFHGGALGVSARPAVTLHGPAEADNFGIAVTGASDFNGDGFNDVAVGIWLSDPAGILNAGAVRVFHGAMTGINASPSRVLDGVSTRDGFGASVANTDVNHDGFSDLVAGAAGAATVSHGRAGTATVFHGGALGVAAVASRVLDGDLVADNFGASVAGAGDINGDGFGDLVIGARLADPGGLVDSGTASVFLGTALGIGTTAAQVLQGSAMSDNFGYSVNSPGDVNRDGFCDLVVGAHFADPMGVMSAGSAQVFHGTVAGSSLIAAQTLGGETANEYFGTSVASAQRGRDPLTLRRRRNAVSPLRACQLDGGRSLSLSAEALGRAHSAAL